MTASQTIILTIRAIWNQISSWSVLSYSDEDVAFLKRFSTNRNLEAKRSSCIGQTENPRFIPGCPLPFPSPLGLHLVVVWRLAYLHDPLGYTGWNFHQFPQSSSYQKSQWLEVRLSTVPWSSRLEEAAALQVGFWVKGLRTSIVLLSRVGALAVSRPLTTMNSTTYKNTILHRSSRRRNRPALSVPVGRADFEKSSTAHTHTHTLTNL